MKIRAYAKVNFILNVLGTLPNGYHEVEMFMQAIDLYDDVDVEAHAAASFHITVESGRPDLECGPGNLAWKAASFMHDAFRKDAGDDITIKIVKRIPVAAGLAGGSADASAVVHGLALLWGIPLSDPALHEVCARLGSDVPFSFMAQTGSPAAIARGTGTDLEETAPVDCCLAVCTPDVAVPTPAVYKALLEEDCKIRADISAFISSETIEEKVRYMGNHLQYPALRMYPQIGEALELLRNTDRPLAVQQSGSGPTVFAVYPPDASPRAPELGSSFIVRTLL